MLTFLGSANMEHLPYARHIWKNKFLNIHCFHNLNQTTIIFCVDFTLHGAKRKPRLEKWTRPGSPSYDSDLGLSDSGLYLLESCLLETPSIPWREGGRKQKPSLPEFWFSGSVDWSQTSSLIKSDTPELLESFMTCKDQKTCIYVRYCRTWQTEELSSPNPLLHKHILQSPATLPGFLQRAFYHGFSFKK